MPLVPYDQASAWQRTTEWWQQAGLGAFEGGGVPNLITNSRAAGRAAAALLATRAPADGPVVVWEAGSGNGRWADQVFAALEQDAGDRGKALAKRLTIVITELSEGTIRETVGQPRIARRIAAGQLDIAVWDITSGQLPHLVSDGSDAPTPVAVFATYVACCIPPKQIRHTSAGWFQLHTLEDEAGEPGRGFLGTAQWEDADLDTLFDDGRHALVVKRTLERLNSGTLVYPWRFAAFMDHLRGYAPEAMLVVNDVGACDEHLMLSSKDRMPQHYEGSMAHSVDFPWFDEWAQVFGGSVLRTGNPLRQVQTAVVLPEHHPDANISAAFTRYVASDTSLDDLADFTEAAYAALQGREIRTATRFYERCHQLDPDNTEFVLNIGQLCMAQGHMDRAIVWMQRGKARDAHGEVDWDAHIAEVKRRQL